MVYRIVCRYEDGNIDEMMRLADTMQEAVDDLRRSYVSRHGRYYIESVWLRVTGWEDREVY